MLTNTYSIFIYMLIVDGHNFSHVHFIFKFCTYLHKTNTLEPTVLTAKPCCSHVLQEGSNTKRSKDDLLCSQSVLPPRHYHFSVVRSSAGRHGVSRLADFRTADEFSSRLCGRSLRVSLLYPGMPAASYGVFALSIAYTHSFRGPA